MRERLWHMLVKEFIQALRNPRMRALIFVTPVIQLFLFGYAVTTDVQHIALAVYDLDHSVASRVRMVAARSWKGDSWRSAHSASG